MAKRQKTNRGRRRGPIRDRECVQGTFLSAFAETGTITAAALIASVSRRTHYDWLENDSSYADAFREAEEEAADALEDEARRRAVDGVEEPVGFYRGEHGGTYVTRYSDALLRFMLEGRRRRVFGARTALTGPGGEGPAVVITRIERVIVDPAVDEDELLR